MLKSVVLAAFLTCGAIGAYAQTTPSQQSSPAPAGHTGRSHGFDR